MQGEISIVPSHNIDKTKWDACIANSKSPLIYGTTTFLDHLADNWTGIILNDYEAVMPVPWRRKWGVSYQYHVPFIQQLGIFFHTELTEISLFTKALFSIVPYGKYPFNYTNTVSGERHTNFVLPLVNGYEKNFSHDALQNIRRSAQFGHVYTHADAEEAIDTFFNVYGKRSRINENDQRNFKKMCVFIGENAKLAVRKVVSKDGNLLAIALLPIDKNRIYNLMNSTLPLGKTSEANYFLLSELWKEFAGTNLIFDFEGSDIPGVKSFYKKFGAIDQPYYRVHFNHLPWPIKMLKK